MAITKHDNKNNQIMEAKQDNPPAKGGVDANGTTSDADVSMNSPSKNLMNGLQQSANA